MRNQRTSRGRKKRCVILRSTPAPACETRCPLPEARIPNRRLSNNSRPGRITNRTHASPGPGTQRSTRAASKPTVPAPPSLYLALGNIPTQPGRHPARATGTSTFSNRQKQVPATPRRHHRQNIITRSIPQQTHRLKLHLLFAQPANTPSPAFPHLTCPSSASSSRLHHLSTWSKPRTRSRV